MSQNLERVREVARGTLSRASTISTEECQMALTERDFINIKEKMNKIDQRIDGLYQNWQAEYKEAITTEQCEEIQKFYEPYVMKYETKYKVLYQILRQASRECTTVPSSSRNVKCSTGLTPQMYSTIDGKLTPTAPVYEDMRTETPLNVMPEESLGGLSAAMGDMEENNVTQQLSDDARGPLSNVASPAVDVSETSPKVINERSSQERLPRRNEVSRENKLRGCFSSNKDFSSIL